MATRFIKIRPDGSKLNIRIEGMGNRSVPDMEGELIINNITIGKNGLETLNAVFVVETGLFESEEIKS